MYRSIPQKSLTRLIAFLLAFCLVGSCFLQSGVAHAITENTEAELTETQRVIEETAQAYNDAVAELEALEEQIVENEQKIAELEEALPSQQEKSDAATVALYKLHQEGFSLIDMLLSAGTLDEFLATYEYINQIQQTNIKEINRLSAMKTELEEVRATLEEDKTDAEAKKTEAEEALGEAQEARQAAQAKADDEAAAEAAAAAEAIAAAEAQEAAEAPPADSGSSGGTENNNDSGSGNAETGGGDGSNNVDWSTDKATFVNEWGARIDAYLAGSPTAGYGRVYAEAAWDYGVDPRYSPAISCTESSKGAQCFKPHNAWGWGSYSWGSWEEAIRAHVGGLSRGYSYTICIADAKKYCPNNWEHWYNTTLNQMNKI